MATNVPKLGEILHGKHERDAIHIAIAPVKATKILHPGQGIGFVSDNTTDVGHVAYPLGIVDPFLQAPVYPGEMFYMFLYPNTITSLRHEWTHPAFADKPEGDATPAYVNQDPDLVQVQTALKAQEIIYAETWLRDFAADVEMTLSELLEAARQWREYGDFSTLGFVTPNRCYNEIDTFWKNYEIYTGEKVSPNIKENFFTCAC